MVLSPEAHLSATVVKLILPFLKDIFQLSKKAGEKAVEKAGEEAGKEMWGVAKTLWQKMRPEVEKDPVTKELVEEAAKNPQDSRVQGSLDFRIERLFKANPQLGEEVRQLLNQLPHNA